MKDKLITYETAVLAKEKGFDNTVYGEHLHYGQDRWYYNEGAPCIYGFTEVLDDESHYVSEINYLIPRPSQSLLQRWLREEHNSFVEVSLHGEEDNNWVVDPINPKFEVEVNYYGKNFDVPTTEVEDFGQYGFKTYEDALEEGLQQALKLIQS